MDMQPTNVAVEFIDVDMIPLADTIRQHIQQWIDEYGKLLREHAKNEMVAISSSMDSKSKELITNPQDLEQLKTVLQVFLCLNYLILFIIVKPSQVTLTTYIEIRKRLELIYIHHVSKI